MDRPNTTARNYLTPPADSFWTWTDDGTQVIWVDGQPIATRSEIEAVLARLAPRGLPPFGAVVMMLAACQLGWRESSTAGGTLAGYVKSLMDRRSTPTPIDTVLPFVSIIGQRIQGVLRGLDAIGALPSDLRERHESKALLAEILFEETKLTTSPEAGGAVVSELARGISGRALVHDTGALAVYDAFMLDIEALKPGLADLSEERVRQRALTGLDAKLLPADLVLPPAEQVRRLIQDLVTDRELAGLARAAQRLIAAVFVPRHLSSPDELPLGGVSDLSNRGPLERLLISELAHDDLTLAVRVALNEALYLRREAPPRTPPERRCILLDAGIRMWGVPRVFAAAAALALSATADRRATLEVHRARKDGVIDVDPLNRNGILALLDALEPAPHPGAALGAWIERLAAASPGADTLSDLVLITHEDVLTDPAFVACLPALKEQPLYCATVNAEGQFRLVLLSRHGRRPICSARINLEEILDTGAIAPRPTQLTAQDENARLPLILSIQPLPLLTPVLVKLENATTGPGSSGAAVTKDGRLLAWRGDGRGAREVTAQIPSGKVLDVSMPSADVVEVLVRRQRTATATLVRGDLETGLVTRCELSGPVSAPRAVRRRGNALLSYTRGRVDAFDTGTGAHISAITGLPAAVRWELTRFFRVSGHWETVVYNGNELTRQVVSGVREGTVELFEREGLDGPWGLVYPCTIYNTATGAELKLALSFPEGPVDILGISRDGHRIAVHPRSKKELHVLDLSRGLSERQYGAVAYALEPALQRSMRAVNTTNLRRNIRGVALAADGTLLLQAAGGRGLALQLTGRRQLELVGTTTVIATSRLKPMQLQGIPFTPVPGPRDTRYALAEAAFADGSRVFLDGRGLLHLKSSAPELPEVTLVLADGPLAAWVSTGQACGPVALTGDVPRVEPEVVWNDLQRIIRRLR